MQSQIGKLWPKLALWSQNQAIRKFFVLGLTLVILAGLGAMIYNSRELLLSYEWRIRPLPLIASFLIYTVALALAALAWGLIMNQIAGESSWIGHLRIYYVTNLTKRLPGVLWYVLGRTVMYDQVGVSKTLVSVGSGLEFILLIVSGIMVSLLSWPLLPALDLGKPWWLLLGLIGGLIVVHPTVINFILHKLRIRSDTFRALRYRSIMAWLFIYFVIWLMGGIILFSVIATIYPISLTLLPGVIGAWGLSGIIAMLGTFSPSGFGLREISLSLLLALLIPSGVAVIAAILIRILLTLYEAGWALIANQAWTWHLARTAP